MPVFISHRSADDEIANAVYRRLKYHHNIECYLDDIDDTLKSKSEQELTQWLVKKINECTNLLAIMTQNTQGSWWVPYEIGVAKQAPRVITSFTNLQEYQLPGYLKEWPRLRGQDAVDKFAYYYKLQKQSLNEEVLLKRASASEQVRTVESFHTQLKEALGQ